MVEAILGVLGEFVQNMFKLFGPFGVGVVLAMAIESACIPLPSEIIMPFAGFLAVQNVAWTYYNFGGEQFSIFVLGMLGAFGCLVGSVLAYAVGKWGGRPFLDKYGKFILISKHDLDMADKFFNKYGEVAIFTSRLLPVIRTFISLPAGISKMRFGKFCVLSMLGSIPWCWALAWIGWKVGKHAADINAYKENLKHILGKWLHVADAVILLAIVAFVVWYVWRHLKHLKAEKHEAKKKKK
jgi:membrane protein DedA with SNARE-associated domain